MTTLILGIIKILIISKICVLKLKLNVRRFNKIFRGN